MEPKNEQPPQQMTVLFTVRQENGDVSTPIVACIKVSYRYICGTGTNYHMSLCPMEEMTEAEATGGYLAHNFEVFTENMHPHRAPNYWDRYMEATGNDEPLVVDLVYRGHSNCVTLAIPPLTIDGALDVPGVVGPGAHSIVTYPAYTLVHVNLRYTPNRALGADSTVYVEKTRWHTEWKKYHADYVNLLDLNALGDYVLQGMERQVQENTDFYRQVVFWHTTPRNLRFPVTLHDAETFADYLRDAEFARIHGHCWIKQDHLPDMALLMKQRLIVKTPTRVKHRDDDVEQDPDWPCNIGSDIYPEDE